MMQLQKLFRHMRQKAVMRIFRIRGIYFEELHRDHSLCRYFAALLPTNQNVNKHDNTALFQYSLNTLICHQNSKLRHVLDELLVYYRVKLFQHRMHSHDK